MDVVAYLSSKGIVGGRPSGREVAYPCFWDCQEPADSVKRKWSINRDTALWQCFVCGVRGGPRLLHKFFGDEPDPAPMARLSRRGAVLESVVRLGEAWLREHDAAMGYLLGERRWLAPEVVVTARLGYVPAGESLVDNLPLGEFEHQDLVAAGVVHPDSGHDFYRDRILIPYLDHGRVVAVRGKDIGGRYYTGPGETVRLFNPDAAGARDVIVVEGEFDCLALAFLLRDLDVGVVGLPGANAVPAEFDALLSGARRVFIGTDPDEAGRRAAAALAERIGVRARVLTWPTELIARAGSDGMALKELDWTTWIGRYGATVAEVVAMMRAASGRRLVTVAEAGLAFRSRPPGGGVKLGFAELDAWMSPGLLPGQVMVPLGKTGVAKTVTLCNIAVNVALRGRRVLFISLEQTREEVYERLARIVRFYHPELCDQDVDDLLAEMLICDENRLSERDFAVLVEEFVDTVGDQPELVLIDYLQYYARGLRGANAYERATAAIFGLKAEAKRYRLPIISPSQVNRGAERGRAIELEAGRDAGSVEETADFVCSLYRPDDAAVGAPAAPTGKVRAELLKSRHGNAGRTTSLQMAPLSLTLVDAFGPDAQRAVEEVWMVARGVTYAEYRRELTAPVQLSLTTG